MLDNNNWGNRLGFYRTIRIVRAAALCRARNLLAQCRCYRINTQGVAAAAGWNPCVFLDKNDCHVPNSCGGVTIFFLFVLFAISRVRQSRSSALRLRTRLCVPSVFRFVPSSVVARRTQLAHSCVGRRAPAIRPTDRTAAATNANRQIHYGRVLARVVRAIILPHNGCRSNRAGIDRRNYGGRR